VVARRLSIVGAAVLVVSGVVGAFAGPAGASPSPIPLLLDQGSAFAIVGHSCGGIQETSYADGFDPVTGYPTGVVDLSTTCGGSGRGGGYHSTTYTGSADVTWDFTGAVVSSTSPATGATDPTLAATDASGNELYGSGTTAYLLLAPTFTPAPRVLAVSVQEGSTAGGTAVTISGTGFTGATAVAFGATPAASFTVASDTSISAVSPGAPSGTVDVTVTSPGGPSGPVAADQFTFVAVPTVTALSPAAGPLDGGNQVTINGTGFTAATQVEFGDQPTAFTTDGDTQITATAPAGESPDTEQVSVTSVGGTSAGGPRATYTYLAPVLCGTAGCVFTSPAEASAQTGVPFTFRVAATGGVVPTFTSRGRLPGGVTLVDDFDGTATLSGTPTSTGRKPVAGVYRIRVTATFVAGTAVKHVTQKLVLTVT
jgi:hypothetical protein